MSAPKSLSIALAVQRKNKSKKAALTPGAQATKEPAMPAKAPDDSRPPKAQYMANHFAKGGEVGPSDFMSDDERAESERTGGYQDVLPAA